MCTTISTTLAVAGSAKGRTGWFHADQAIIGYDHPSHVDLEHAVSLDLVASTGAPGDRVAVELSVEAARALAHQLLATADEAERYEAVTGA